MMLLNTSRGGGKMGRGPQSQIAAALLQFRKKRKSLLTITKGEEEEGGDLNIGLTIRTRRGILAWLGKKEKNFPHSDLPYVAQLTGGRDRHLSFGS